VNVIKILQYTAIILVANLSLGQNPDSKATSRSQPSTLKGNFENMKDKSETYQIYKVIPRERLDAFWSAVEDSLALNARNLNQVRTELGSTSQDVTNLRAQLEENEAALEQVTYKRDRISFLGIDLVKSTYSTMAWGMIFFLSIVVAVFYLKFTNSNRVTTKVKKEHQGLLDEFEEFRNRAREKEIKLKRELQTEINSVEELKQKVTIKKI